jgi:hypothetical protein
MSEANVAQRQQHEDSVRYGLHYSQIAIVYFVASQQHNAVRGYNVAVVDCSSYESKVAAPCSQVANSMGVAHLQLDSYLRSVLLFYHCGYEASCVSAFSSSTCTLKVSLVV